MTQAYLQLLGEWTRVLSVAALKPFSALLGLTVVTSLSPLLLCIYGGPVGCKGSESLTDLVHVTEDPLCPHSKRAVSK